MDRDGPGFLADLVIFWLTLMACLVVADLLVRIAGETWGFLLGLAGAVVVVFVVMLAYHRVYLDERPILGSSSRTRFAVLFVQLVLVGVIGGFVIGAIVGSPNPAVQVALAAGIVLASIVVAHHLVYRIAARAGAVDSREQHGPAE